MARVKENLMLSIIIPTLNEASNLPLLLADLSSYKSDYQINIIDGGSKDSTISIAKIAGANIETIAGPNRGFQLHNGALLATGEWLFFLHADCRMIEGWGEKISLITETRNSDLYAWFFDFKINKTGVLFRLLEMAVFIRSTLFNRPYGDQGLLIKKDLYFKLGGYKKIPIMEDLDFIQRILKLTELKRLNCSINTNGRRWEKTGILKNALKNALLRYRWSRGEDPEKLYKDYYSLK